MRLLHSPTSPYARKVRVVAIEKGVADKIDAESVDPLADPPQLLAGNPLAKVPCLLLDDGTALFDSAVICEYLDALAPEPVLLAAPGPQRWATLRLQALADGVLDAAVALRQESLRPEAQRSPAWQSRWNQAIRRALARLGAELPTFERHFDLGAIAAACALDYLDFRHPAIDWRDGQAPLSAWLQRVSARASMATTQPPA